MLSVSPLRADDAQHLLLAVHTVSTDRVCVAHYTFTADEQVDNGNQTPNMVYTFASDF